LNQPAYERIVAGYSKFCLIAEQELEIKHEGAVLCYELELTSHTFTAAAPDWLSKEP
jgi:hypothetical protein